MIPQIDVTQKISVRWKLLKKDSILTEIRILFLSFILERNQDFVFVFHSTAIVVGLEGLNIGKILRHFPDKK